MPPPSIYHFAPPDVSTSPSIYHSIQTDAHVSEVLTSHEAKYEHGETRDMYRTFNVFERLTKAKHKMLR